MAWDRKDLPGQKRPSSVQRAGQGRPSGEHAATPEENKRLHAKVARSLITKG